MQRRVFLGSRNQKVMIALLIVAFAAALRTIAIGVDGLWFDELFGASYVNLPIIDIVIAVLRFDIHPPFYYLQLGIWSLISKNDWWLLFNSIAWSLASLCLASFWVYRISNQSIAPALCTAIIIAVLGSEVYFASELRMYAMISCLTLLGWIRADLWSMQPTRKNAIYLLLVIAAISGTHSTSFIPISAILFYAFASYLINQNNVDAKQIVSISGLCAAILAPWLINASFRSVSHTTLPTIDGVLATFSGWLLGYGDVAIPSELKYALGIAVVCLVVYLFFFGGMKEKIIIVSFIVWPSLALIIISVIFRPIWIDRAVAFSAPFLAVSISLFWYEKRPSDLKSTSIGPHYATAFALAFGIAAMSIMAWFQAITPRKMQYRGAAEYLAKVNTNKLAIWVPVNVNFWGMARYLEKPNWGNLLEIQDPKKPDESTTWEKIYAQLGPVWLKRLHLQPMARQIKTDSGVLWIGLSPLPKDVQEAGFWVVGDSNVAGSGACADASPLEIKEFRGVVVMRCGAQ